MTPAQTRQGDLFANDTHLDDSSGAGPLPPPLLRHQLLVWQERLAAHQEPLLGGGGASPSAQGDLFAAEGDTGATSQAIALDPLNLQAQSLSFWRWPEAPQSGAAIYLVMDRPAASGASLLLYVGETAAAERRWKGEHDCKRYLDAYAEALQRADLPLTLSIRFWLEVPQQTRPRRDLEQALIRRWLPPFNKETRGRWATPFTAPSD
ncbi:MAG: GIY-YIG nuclease family protein [Synechococcus sp. ELA057]